MTSSNSAPRLSNPSAASQVATAPRVRLSWPDVGRGLATIGIVIMHVTNIVPGARETAVLPFNEFNVTYDLPLFFLISGFFSGKLQKMRLGQLLGQRVWPLFLPYVVWCTMDLVVGKWVMMILFDAPMPTFDEIVRNYVWGIGMFWFFHALVLYTVLFWLARPLPPILAVALSMAPPIWQLLGHELKPNHLSYLAFFFIGAYARPLVQWITTNAHRSLCSVPLVLLAVWVYLEVFHVAPRWADPRNVPHTLIPSGKLDVELIVWLFQRWGTVGLALILSVWLSRVAIVSPLLQWCGRHSLELYIGHIFGYTVATGVLMALHWEQCGVWERFGWTMLGAVLGCVVIVTVKKIPGVGWLVQPPKLGR